MPKRPRAGNGIMMCLTGSNLRKLKIWRKEVSYFLCILMKFHTNELLFPAQSWFETQEEDKPEEVEAEIPTVLAGENNSCEMCHELFEQFYNNEKDEWHFRDAIRVDDDKVYHPHCYQDLQVCYSGIP